MIFNGNFKEQFSKMRVPIIPLILILLMTQLPFGNFQPEEGEEKKTPVKGWWVVSYFAVPPTKYSTPSKGIIKAESVGSRASLFKKVDEKQKHFSILCWRWKISNVIRSSIETRKDRFDAPARVMVIFEEGARYKLFGRGEPYGLKIEYIWATRQPKGHLFDHPGEGNCKVFVLESGEEKVSQWVYEERNIRKDFKTAFGKDPHGVIAIGIQTDTDHSNEMVTAYYSEPILKKR